MNKKFVIVAMAVALAACNSHSQDPAYVAAAPQPQVYVQAPPQQQVIVQQQPVYVPAQQVYSADDTAAALALGVAVGSLMHIDGRDYAYDHGRYYYYSGGRRIYDAHPSYNVSHYSVTHVTNVTNVTNVHNVTGTSAAAPSAIVAPKAAPASMGTPINLAKSTPSTGTPGGIMLAKSAPINLSKSSSYQSSYKPTSARSFSSGSGSSRRH